MVKITRGRYSPEGLPAYGVYDEQGNSLGRGWKKKGRGQRAGDWYWEADGGRPFRLPRATRYDAVEALVLSVSESASWGNDFPPRIFA